MELSYVKLVFIIGILLPYTTCLHLKGTWNSEGFFLFLAKFGFQKTTSPDLDRTQGYIFGNITTDSSLSMDLMLVVVDSEYFIEFYTNRTLPRKAACPRMFNKIDTIAFDVDCKPKGQQDFLRRVPCPYNMLCPDEDDPQNVVPGYQFTYKVRDTERPRFWYVSIVACYRETVQEPRCQWRYNRSQHGIVAYDIWMVNGDPSAKHLNPFEHQFSFELHDVFEIHLMAIVLCSLLFLLWLYAFRRQQHTLTKIFTVSFLLEMVGISCSLLDTTIFAFNGWGAEWLGITGTLVRVLSQCLFMLFLLLIAKGWEITTDKLSRNTVLFTLWGIYTVLNIVLFVWNKTEVDIISNFDEWQTYSGYLTLAFRLVIMMWFLWELRQTFRSAVHPDRLNFFQHFGAFCLVWFVYLPVLALIATQVSALWRFKTVLSISYAADVLAYAVLIHLFWPSKSVLYMIKGEVPLQTYDLEITGLLDDIQETTLFARTTGKSDEEEEGDELLGHVEDKKSNGNISNGKVNHVTLLGEPEETSL
ncbi:transmembrane protein 145-like [Haliotis cracherodii]|uniref:transmembrane protein 145-like n=1 Tax=Haliotis cracherodii TaxID=6455 RepID=UPI0039EAB056